MLCIPFNRPFAIGKEFEYIQQAVTSGHTAGDGAFTRKCSQLLAEELGANKVLLTTSCTHALEIMALLLDLQPGDEVIVPSFTFVSTLNPFVLRGAKPVFVDIRPDTLNMDETQIEKHINTKTRAIVPVHYAGVGCEMDSILETASEYGVTVLEDNAHGLFGRYKNRQLGTFGAMAAQSFHDTKNFSCGEGGALLINDPFYIERAEILREKGTDRSRFFRGQVDKYTWVDVGSSYLPSDMLAAYLYAQLEARQQIQAKRQQIWQYYYEHLQDWAEAQNVQLPTVPAHCDQAYHMFYLLLPSLEQRQSLIGHLKAQGVSSVFHYLPLHLSQMGRRFGGKEGNCPVTESVSDRLLRLPFFNSFTEAEQAQVVAAIRSFRC
ncbi:dTDP-4-amino-4,6-dideoxygalactose transaminase [Microcoleus sp. FACHB-1515]|uniref:dTDP-4-amino-4,6-dideoxygalactose transaminase n=1 Tax=Cyanophyceae TaxID=3028117 RepID=UPI0018EFCE70|nr:dTDP-4-amino-4,6-dideoxygalactose transaminase [Microcoleus sp. FACHB-1515]